MNQSEELVSIIVPMYNAGIYIEETVNSVCAQTYAGWELILVDDNSKDDTVSVVKNCLALKGGGKIRLIEKKTNEGAAAARNTGIDAAKGRYIAFLDADDLWMPDKLEKELAFMKKNQAAFVFTAYEFGDENALGTGKIVHVPEKLTYKKALSRTVIFTTTVLFDSRITGRDLIKMPMVKSEDTATWWKVLKSGITAYGLDEVLAIYRRPASSLSSNKLEAVRRIWNLYTRQEKLSLPYSCYNLFFWAVRATLRRL